MSNIEVREASASPSDKRRKGRGTIKSQLLGIVVVLLILATAGMSYKYWQAEKTVNQLRSNPEKTLQTNTQKIISEVSKLVQLPTGETPTVALVNNIAKLQGQPFFVNAKDGDELLIYTQAKKAILYRPLTNKIIEYSTINLST